MNAPLPIVPQDSTDPREVFATGLARLAPLPQRLTDVLTEMETVAEREQIPIIGRLEGAVVQMLVLNRGGNARRILDIGTAIGYSALWLASALPPGGTVTSIEIDPARAARARGFIEQAGYADRIEVVVGDAFEVVPDLGGYDVIFQDVMKHHYFGSDPCLAVELLKLCTSHLDEQGVLFIDNALCGGAVLDPSLADGSNELIGIQSLNEMLVHDPDFISVILPVRDGLWMARRVGSHDFCGTR
jgi:O-methyltransferase